MTLPALLPRQPASPRTPHAGLGWPCAPTSPRLLPLACSLQGTFLEIAGFIFSRGTAAPGWEGMGSDGVGGPRGVDVLPLPHLAPALATRGWGGLALLCVSPIAAVLAGSWPLRA